MSKKCFTNTSKKFDIGGYPLSPVATGAFLEDNGVVIGFNLERKAV